MIKFMKTNLKHRCCTCHQVLFDKTSAIECWIQLIPLDLRSQTTFNHVSAWMGYCLGAGKICSTLHSCPSWVKLSVKK